MEFIMKNEGMESEASTYYSYLHNTNKCIVT